MKCASSMFDCGDGTCLHPEEVCDGIKHCANAKDELHCEGRCKDKDLFECPSSGTCLAESMVCDGVKDCPDGADESVEQCGDQTPPPDLISRKKKSTVLMSLFSVICIPK